MILGQYEWFAKFWQKSIIWTFWALGMYTIRISTCYIYKENITLGVLTTLSTKTNINAS